MSSTAKNVDPQAAGYGRRSLLGGLWTTGATVGIKISTFFAQILLAWLLVPEDFGLVALALSISEISSRLAAVGLQNVLVESREKFDEYANSALWLSVLLGVVRCVLILIVGGIVTTIYGKPEVFGLIAVLAVAAPLMEFALPYSAALTRDLRFGLSSLINLTQAVLRSWGAVLLAWLGFGAYALVLPYLVVALSFPVLCRLAAGAQPVGRPSLRYWRELLRPGLMLLVHGLSVAGALYGVNLIIGWHFPTAQVGLFYWGMTMSVQAIFLLTQNVQTVLFATMTRLRSDRQREAMGARRALHTMVFGVGLVCVVQILLAGPLVHWLFDPKWHQAIPVIRILSLGFIAQPVQVLLQSMLMAHGRYRALAGVSLTIAAVQLGGTAVGATFGGIETAAWGLAGGLLLLLPFVTLRLLHELGQDWRQLPSWLVLPLLPALVAVAAGYATASRLGSAPPWVVLVVVGAATALAQLIAGRILLADTINYLLAVIRRRAPA